MADLLAIRTRLVDESGRFELAVDPENDDYTDAGGTQVINDAIAWLNSIRADLAVVLSSDSFALLTTETSSNYWSEDKPHLLVNAARRMLEVRQRNTSGVNDWDRVIVRELSQIYANAVKASIDADITTDEVNRVMEG